MMTGFGTGRSLVARMRGVAVLLAVIAGCTAARAETFANWDMWRNGSFRGFGVSTDLTDRDWSAFDTTGANLARMFVVLGPPVDDAYTLPADAYAKVDRLLAKANLFGFKALIAFNPKPNAPDSTYWFSTAQQDSLVATLRDFAAHYSGEAGLAGIDIINEPYPVTQGHPEAPTNFDGPAAWAALSARIITAVREADPTRVIIYEWPFWGGAYDNLQPVPFDGVVYSTHWYAPLQVTHQGIAGRPTGYPYPTPDTYGIGVWNRDVMRGYLQKLKTFQQTWNVPIFVGEFSCARSIPGNTCWNYDTDVVSILEEFGFDWSYHQYRGDPIWEPERPAGYPTAPRNPNTDLMTFLRTTMLTKNP